MKAYDAVLCVSPKNTPIALKAIRSLHLFAEPRSVLVITSRNCFAFFEEHLGDEFPVQLVDEDNVIEDLTLSKVQEYLVKRVGSSFRAGWYFQQFLKMSVSDHPGIADHYLVWDSDTILLHPIDFLDQEGRALVNPRTEYHKPYFNLLERVLGLKRQVGYSFISEHFMINRSYMHELIIEVQEKAHDKQSWTKLLLDSIDTADLAAGFSEYETYGNYLALHHKDSFECRPLKSLRSGARYFGKDPDKYGLFALTLAGFAFVTFESWQSTAKGRKTAAVVLSRSLFAAASLSRLLGVDMANRRLITAARLCG